MVDFKQEDAACCSGSINLGVPLINWAPIVMPSAKVTTLLPALSTRFAHSFEFTLDGPSMNSTSVADWQLNLGP
jgi:hypothetical protein